MTLSWKYFSRPPCGFVCSGRNDSESGVRMTRPLMVMPLARASSRAAVTDRPELLVPSPETSMTRRSALKGARSSWMTAKSMAWLIAVLPENDRGSSTSLPPKLRADSASAITVQSTTTFCWPAVAHSRKQTAMRRLGPDAMARTTSGWVMAAAAPSRCSLNLGSVTLRETSAASTSSRSTGSAARAAGGQSVDTRLSSATTILIARVICRSIQAPGSLDGFRALVSRREHFAQRAHVGDSLHPGERSLLLHRPRRIDEGGQRQPVEGAADADALGPGRRHVGDGDAGLEPACHH